MRRFKINIVVAMCFMLTSVSGSDSVSGCSCYTFYGNSSGWQSSRSLCQALGGDLVSIETLQEWNIIKTQMENKTTDSSANQWWIGLVPRKNAEWKWLSNHTLTYNKWQPDMDAQNLIYVVIDKSTQRFWKTTKDLQSGKICEYKGKDCTKNQVKWRTVPTHQPTTVETTTELETTTNKPSTTTTETILQKLTTVSCKDNPGNKGERSVRPEKKPFPILILVIVLVVVLLACIGILIVVWMRKSKRKGTHRLSKKRKGSGNAHYMYDQYPDEERYHVALSQEQSTKGVTTADHHATAANTQEEKIHVKDDLQASAQGHVKIVAAENGTVSQEEELTENMKTETEEKTRVDAKELPKRRVHPGARHNDEIEDEVFYSEDIQELQQQNHTPQDSLDQDNYSLPDKTTAVYETIDKSNKHEPTQPLYAQVNDAKKGDQPKDVTYAELTEFQFNNSKPLKKPTPYYPTEYASVTVHPLSPRSFER